MQITSSLYYRSFSGRTVFGCKPRSHLDFLFPEVGIRVRKEQEHQKKRHDEHAKTRTFRMGDIVCARNFSGNGPKWILGKVTAMTGTWSLSLAMISKCEVIFCTWLWL